MMTMMTGISNWLISYRPAVQILAAIVLMVCGAGCMIPSEKLRRGRQLQFLMLH